MAIKLFGSWWRNFFGEACTFYSPITTSLFIRVTQRSAYLSLSLSWTKTRRRAPLLLLRAPLLLTGGRKATRKKEYQSNTTTSTLPSAPCRHRPCHLLLHRQQLLLKIKRTALYQGKKARCEHGLWLKVSDLPKYGERKNSMILGVF